MVVVMGTARFGEGELARMRDAMRAQLKATRAEEGCLHYSFAVDVLDENLMHIAERWRDQAAIDAHFRSPHMAAFNAALASARVSEVSVKAWDGNGERTLMGN